MRSSIVLHLSDEMAHGLDQMLESFESRSACVEYIVSEYLKNHDLLFNSRDLGILNQHASELNEEAEDVLSYQVPL